MRKSCGGPDQGLRSQGIFEPRKVRALGHHPLSRFHARSYPPEKRFHRFFPLDAEDFYYPEDRSPHYTIIEIAMFEGRPVEAKEQLFRLLYERARDRLGLEARALEITITETPRHDWGIRGWPGDELALGYSVDPRHS